MSIKVKNPADIKALQQTLLQYPHIEEVYFTRTGDHYLRKQELMQNGKGTKKFYGFLKTDMQLSKVEGERKFFKMVSVANPDAEIVETLSRDEVLAIKVDNVDSEKPLSKKDKKIVDELTSENEALKQRIAELEKDKEPDVES